jgi:ABC-type Na+ efflux pump permease subunit
VGNRHTLGRILGLSLLAVAVGTVWAYCGLAECDRSDCGPVLSALFYTSGIGLMLMLLGAIGSSVSGVGLLVIRFRR